jgi:hypothetical protein
VNDSISPITEWLLSSLPYYLIIGVGLVISLRHRKNSPQLSKLFAVAFILFASQSVLGSAKRHWFAQEAAHRTLSIVTLGTTFAVISFLLAILYYSAWGILIYAVHRSLKTNSVA